MNIAFFYECGKIDEIGTGHKYRSEAIGTELRKRNHNIEFLSTKDIPNNTTILVIDHMNCQRDLIAKAKSLGIKTVLIDGAEEDVNLVDASISCFVNCKAKYTGARFIAFPKHQISSKYFVKPNDNKVFVSMGGFDKNNYARTVIDTLLKLNRPVIMTRSINISDIGIIPSNVSVFKGDNYFDAMKECSIAITNGGLSFFQALYFGMPTIAIPQYEHQKINIDRFNQCCLQSDISVQGDLELKISFLDDIGVRKALSMMAQYNVDGNGLERICDIIEGLA
jgi:spore coat polysaccharide biosynthesis predicted glycosyltransferase SpsG